MADILYTPNRERVITTNAWAFLHWLKTVHGVPLADWTTLQRFSVERSADFRAAVAVFARLPGEALCLARHSGTQEALVFRRIDGSRPAFSRDEVGQACGDSLSPAPVVEERSPPPFAGIAALLARLWPPATLIRPLAELLLHADLRPDDRLLVVGPAWPWLAALLEGTAVILAAPSTAALLAVTAEERASVLVAPSQTLGEAAFQRSRHRPDLANLRAIIATGGPLSPEGRRRIYTWVKPDLMLLARTGDTVWGNPLEPVLAQPPATPALLTPPASDPATP
jgi:hypothetical protein